MKAKFPPFVGLAAACCFLVAACGKKSGTHLPQSIEGSATQLEQLFDDANAQAQKNAQIASQAMRDQEWEKAVTALNSFNQFENVTYEQAMSVKMSVKNLQYELASRIETDPAARRAWEKLKAASRD